MKNCAICPHQSDCLNVGSCLDDLNAPWTSKGLHPPLMTPAQVIRCISALELGVTRRRMAKREDGAPIVGAKKFKKHCSMFPTWGKKAIQMADKNTKAADLLKSPKLYRRSCKHGHSLDEGRIYFKYGYVCRRCRKCDKIRNDNAGLVRPEVAARIAAALRNGATINQIIHGRPAGGGRRDRSLVLVYPPAFYRYRRENPNFDKLVLGYIENRILSKPNPVLDVPPGTYKYDWHPSDQQFIEALLPANFPEKEVVVQEIIVSLLEGRLDRSQIRDKVRWFIRDQNVLFPTKYRTFGNSRLLSLDDTPSSDSSTTFGDMVSVGLWD
jgi:hypothetical protein